MVSLSLPVGLTLLASIVLLIRLLQPKRILKGLRLPPGPPPKLLIGNVLDIPKEREWETYSKWTKDYGEIVYIHAFGTEMVFINSRRLAYELFEKRSSIYSDRPNFPMIVDLMGMGWAMTLQRYGDWWRRHRRAMHEKFHPTASEAYKPVQLKHTRDLLKRLLQDPEHYSGHIRQVAGAIIMEITYGIHVKEKDDPYILTAEQALIAAGEAAVPGRFIVDILPWMKYIPEWVPGASFKAQARIWRKYIIDMAELPFAAVQSAMASGIAEPSFVSTHLENLSAKKATLPNEEEVIKGAAAIIFAGGSDTVRSRYLLITFLDTLIGDIPDCKYPQSIHTCNASVSRRPEESSKRIR